MNGKFPTSKSTTADSNNQDDPYFHMQQQLQQIDPIRGVNPESNINLQTDELLLDSKKDKCIEIFKNSTIIHDILQKQRQDELMSSYNLDLQTLI